VNRHRHAAAAASLDAALEMTSDTFQSGDSVVLTGFGTFEAADRPAGEARNPRTGGTLTAAAKRVSMFEPGKALRDES
jgi:DNA-binding protein HU-beta